MNKLSEHRKILMLGGSSLFLGIVFVILFYEQELGINFPLFGLLVVACGLLMANVFSKKVEIENYIIIILALFFSFMVFVRSSDLLTFFNVIGCVLLLLVVVRMFTGGHIKTFLFGDYLKVFFLPFLFIGPFFETFPAIVSLQKNAGDKTKTKEIIRGSLMAVIALIVFAWLFSSADAVFNKILSDMFIFEINQDLINRVIICAAITAFFIGGFGYMFRKLHHSLAPSVQKKERNLGIIETTILFSSINTLFGIFIFLQISYLFGGESHLIAQGLTYSEYARAGFFQLILVAILSYLIISFAEKQIIMNDGLHLRTFKVLSGILVFQVILILVSAFSRLSLYEDAYGFTTIRLYGHALMIWLGMILVLISRHIWTNGERAAFAFRAFCAVIMLLIAVNMLNPDVFIAQKNLERYQKTGQLDAPYLASLSGDALPYTIQLLDDPHQNIRNSFANGLYFRYRKILNETPQEQTWQSGRLNRTKIQELIAPRKQFIEEHKTLMEDASLDASSQTPS